MICFFLADSKLAATYCSPIAVADPNVQADSPNVINNRSELSFEKVFKIESENQSSGDEYSNKGLEVTDLDPGIVCIVHMIFVVQNVCVPLCYFVSWFLKTAQNCYSHIVLYFSMNQYLG